MDSEKKAYLVRNKNLCVIWILNGHNSSKWSLDQMVPLQGVLIAKRLENEGDGPLVQLYYPINHVVGTTCSYSGYRDSILQSGINLRNVRPLPYSTNNQ